MPLFRTSLWRSDVMCGFSSTPENFISPYHEFYHNKFLLSILLNQVLIHKAMQWYICSASFWFPLCCFLQTLSKNSFCGFS
ncbi:hypothetical protein QQF64_016673 [Cirrhinus molitorella]|uniref:Uncharacterized protein n=1 Tax=Cirrhinus molitorella TaxID=172907 RepID=A0ABR3LRY2_9TELE